MIEIDNLDQLFGERNYVLLKIQAPWCKWCHAEPFVTQWKNLEKRWNKQVDFVLIDESNLDTQFYPVIQIKTIPAFRLLKLKDGKIELVAEYDNGSLESVIDEKLKTLF